MRVVYLTAGAAGMYCGSCMHDNTLARALINRGVDCMLVPTYTPIRTDEQDVSSDEVFFGGINIFLEQSLPLWGRLPRWTTSWLDSPRLLRLATRKAGNTSPKLLGALTVSMLQGLKGRQCVEVQRLCDWLKEHGKPDVIILSNFLIGGCVDALKQQLGIPILVTLQGDDIFLDFLPEKERAQSIALMRELTGSVDTFIVNTEFYGQKMGKILGLSTDRWRVVPLGIDDKPFSGDVAPRSELPTKIGYLARIDPAKGLHHLVDAFIELSKTEDASTNETELHVAGWLGNHNVEYANEQWQRLDDAGLQGRYKYHGSPDQNAKIEFLRQLDLFCVPTEYEEPKGLFVLEAMAMGLPVIAPNHGAFPELIESGSGLLVPPGECKELASALASLISDKELRSHFGETGRRHVLENRTADQMAIRLQDVIETLL